MVHFRKRSCQCGCSELPQLTETHSFKKGIGMKIPHSPSSVDNLVNKLLYAGKMKRMTGVFIESPIF